MRKRPSDFVPSQELTEAAMSALGSASPVSVARAMLRGKDRVRLREEQYRSVMKRQRQQPEPPLSEAAAKTAPGSGAALKSNEARLKANGGMKMDTREFIGSFLKPEDVSTPVVLTIANVAEGKFDKLDLTFDDGSKLGLNNTNGRKVARAWGYESDAWINKQVELSAGRITYKDEEQDTIVLTPISPAMPANEPALAKSLTLGGPIDDDIPF
jgi:hypothetical protein